MITKYKDPGDTLDYSIDWSRELAANADTIVDSSWTVASGLTLEQSSHTTTEAVAWISGGTNGEEYVITNEITTTSRTYNRSIKVVIHRHAVTKYKDPDEVLDYWVDLTRELANVVDTIATVAWTVPTGLVTVDQTNTATRAVVWLSGGTEDAEYTIIPTITTAASPVPRVYVRPINIKVQSR